VGLDLKRLLALRDAGLDSIQISFQSDAADLGDRIAGANAHRLKRPRASSSNRGCR
jgi:hypothetical protein